MASPRSFLFLSLLVVGTLFLICPPTVEGQTQAWKRPKNYTFYMHNTLRNFTNENFTAIITAEPANLDPKYNQFGMLITIENPLTENISNMSKRLGTARGFFLYDSQPVHIMFMVFTAVIENDKYNGTIELFGQNPTNIVGYRYLSVIGGTGDFFLARGLAKLRFLGAKRNLVDKQVTWIVSFELDLVY